MAAAVGCGEGFENERRAPVPIELTAVIQADGVTVSPRRVGAGPIRITISNQTERARAVTLQGVEATSHREDSARERVGEVERARPIAPGGTATLQTTVRRGAYELRARPKDGGAEAVTPAVLDVGPARAASNDRVLLP